MFYGSWKSQHSEEKQEHHLDSVSLLVISLTERDSLIDSIVVFFVTKVLSVCLFVIINI